MSTFEKQALEETAVIRKAKYKVKNAEGKYEVVYLETSADQVEETAERVFVSPAEKAKIASNESAISAETQARTEADTVLSGRLDVIEGEGEGSVKKALVDAKAYTDTKVQEVNGANAALGGRVDTLEETVTTHTSEISNLKDTIANKNNNTIVVETEAEIATANAKPKVGDLAFVINSKRAYIYKGTEVSVLIADSLPAGWVVFDEITNELDLVDYLKATDAESLYRKIADKIAEADLDTTLAGKINNKADKSYVDEQLAGKTTEAYVNSQVSPLSTKVTTVESDLASEISNRESAVTAVDGKVTALQSTVSGNYTEVTNKINKNLTVISAVEPTDTLAGHVWLEIQA